MEQEYGITKANDIKNRISTSTKKSMKKYIIDYDYTCYNCGKVFTLKIKPECKNNKHVYCSKKCYYEKMKGNDEYGHGFKKDHIDYNTDKTKKQNSRRMKEKWKNDTVYRQKMIEVCKNINPMLIGLKKRKEQNLNRGYISSQQDRLFLILKEKYGNIKFEIEYPLKRLNTNRKFYLDIAIPSLRIDIEYDGKFWHEKEKEKDNLRDKEIKKLGWEVIRVTTDNWDKRLKYFDKIFSKEEFKC